jgi:hypothetical protein
MSPPFCFPLKWKTWGVSWFSFSKKGGGPLTLSIEVEHIEDQIHEGTDPVSLKPLDKPESWDPFRIECYDFSVQNGAFQVQVLKLLDDGRIFRIEPKAPSVTTN